MNNQKFAAVVGCDYIRNSDHQIVKRTEQGWIRYAKQCAAKYSKRDRFAWHGVVAWIEWRDCYRVNFAGQPEKL